ncbi:hypothetical protein B0H10DRAFT_1836884, partial [Mycena sp. CBHHK59/15]
YPALYHTLPMYFISMMWPPFLGLISAVRPSLLLLFPAPSTISAPPSPSSSRPRISLHVRASPPRATRVVLVLTHHVTLLPLFSLSLSLYLYLTTPCSLAESKCPPSSVVRTRS